jgi:hypothetical protein
MTIVCVVHDRDRIVDVRQDGDHYEIREWEGGQRQEIRLTDGEVGRIVNVIMEMQQERLVAGKTADDLEPVHPFGMDRY